MWRSGAGGETLGSHQNIVAGFLKPYLKARLVICIGDKTILLYTAILKCMCGHMACWAAWAP